MICCCIKEKDPDRIKAILEKVEMAEIRLDLCGLTQEQIEDVFTCSDTPLIATCRAGNSPENGFAAVERTLCSAIRAGAHFADLEIEAPKGVSKRIAEACAQWGTTLIRSYHNFEYTPDIEQLKAIVDRCRHHDGELVKIVTAARCQEDVDTVLSLYKYYTPESLIAFAIPPVEDEVMDRLCRQSRLSSLAKGSPFAYSCWGCDSSTAPGQMTYSQMYSIVYGNFKSVEAIGLRSPASKSYTQRAILCAALSDGVSTISGYTSCTDSESAIAVAESLGATITKKMGQEGMTSLEIHGTGASNKGRNPSDSTVIDVGESGLLARLMIPLAAQFYNGTVIIKGSGTLSNRPMEGAGAALEAMGGKLTAYGTSQCVPLAVCGPLKGGYCEVDGRYSSQIISGALTALPLCGRNSTIRVKSPTSIPYIYMTMDILRKAGIKVRSEMYQGRQLLADDWSKCTEMVLKIKEGQQFKPFDTIAEGDWSAASVFLCLGAIFGHVTIDGLDTTSLQADLGILDILMDAGAVISQDGEPCGTISVHKAPLRCFSANLSNCPDLFPVASVLCAFCHGRNVLRGVHRLAHKESDRASAILDTLLRLGVKASITGDDLVIEGESLPSRIMNGRLLKGGRYSSYHDHRMVMALSLAGVGTESPVEIDDMDCVRKSYPEFNGIWHEYIR